jgi:hypothetical protein
MRRHRPPERPPAGRVGVDFNAAAGYDPALHLSGMQTVMVIIIKREEID